MVYFVNTIYLKKVKYENQLVYLVEHGRTPVIFTDLEEAKKFVAGNCCDWEEAGYYNYADIQGVKENCCYPEIQDGQVTHDFYSTEDGWIDCEFVEFEYGHTCQIEGKKIVKKVNGQFYPYNGLVDIG